MVNISAPNKTNNVYRMGWLNRIALSFTPYGLYMPITIDGKAAGLNYNSTLDEWEATSIRLAQNNTKGFVKILDWGATPESIDKITSGSNNYIIPPNNLTNSRTLLRFFSSTDERPTAVANFSERFISKSLFV